MLAQIARQRQNQSKARYVPVGNAATLLTSDASIVVLSGPAGTGKSRAALEKLHNLAIRNPGFRAAIVRKTRKSLTNTALVTFERFVMQKAFIANPNVKRESRSVYHFVNGSAIECAGLDDPSKILSAEYDIIYVMQGEEISQNDAETLTTRLRSGVLDYEQLIIDCNPGSAMHWLHINKTKYEWLESYHVDNPTLWDSIKQNWTERGKRYIDKLKALTGVRYKRLFLGLWVSAEGAVYTEFNNEIHVIDRFAIPKDWLRLRVIDFGFTNPFVCQWWAFDPLNHDLILYREIYATQTLVEDHAQTINALSQGEVFYVSIADHDAEDRATLLRYGIDTQPAYKAVTLGIEAVQVRLRNAKGRDVSGNGIYFMRDSLVAVDELLAEAHKPTCTLDEIDGYVWELAKDGKPIKEAPVKLNDHGMDAMRYIVAFVDGVGSELQEENYIVIDEDHVEISRY
jgi:PBSX family phage terminase large subunit